MYLNLVENKASITYHCSTPSIVEILAYIDDLIDAEANLREGATEHDKALAVGIIIALEDIKDWLKSEGT